MSRVGGKTSKYYKEVRGIKVSGGQKVKAGTVLTREGQQWKPGHNVVGAVSLTARCDGEVYFTRKKGKNKKVRTYIHIRPAPKKKKSSTPKG